MLRCSVARVVLASLCLAPGPGLLAQEEEPIVRQAVITVASVDFATHPPTLAIHGRNFSDTSRVRLGKTGPPSQELGIVQVTPTYLVAALPDPISDGTYRLQVSPDAKLRKMAKMDVAIVRGGSTGPQGPPGPTGLAGPVGPPGPPGQDGADAVLPFAGQQCHGPVVGFDAQGNALCSCPLPVDGVHGFFFECIFTRIDMQDSTGFLGRYTLSSFLRVLLGTVGPGLVQFSTSRLGELSVKQVDGHLVLSDNWISW